MKHKVIAGSLFVLGMLAGCGAQPGRTDVKFESGKEPIMAEALHTGTYALYRSSDAAPQVRYYVRRGEPLGFRAAGNGIVAVAGDHEVPIKESKVVPNYYWKYQGEK